MSKTISYTYKEFIEDELYYASEKLNDYCKAHPELNVEVLGYTASKKYSRILTRIS